METNRGEIDYCVISEQTLGMNYVVSHRIEDGISKLIKLDTETPFSFMISETDKNDFKLEPGKLVTIAYDKQNPQTSRVVWCYSDNEKEIQTHPKKSGFYKDKSTDSSENNCESELDKSLTEGKNILVIGGDFKKLEFSNLAREYSFNLTMLTGHEKEVQIEAAIRKNDMIFVTSGHLSHHRTELPREICKRINKPMRLIQSSLAGLKRGILDLLENPGVIIHSVY